MRKASLMGAETNHLWPVSRYSWPGPSAPTGTARVELARTSDPPCFSVRAMPMVQPVFWSAGMKRESYSVEVTRGSHTSATSGCSLSDGTTAKVMVMGHPTPDSTCESM